MAAGDTLTYQDAGVDPEQAERALRNVFDAIVRTHDERVVSGIGGFGALYAPNFSQYERPVLVSTIDGVGTKTKVAAMAGQYKGLGHDIVNHCINDVICQGARPLFFLDYFGASSFQPLIFEQVLDGASEACMDAGVALVGGETAEMPGVFVDGEVDVVGCMVGIVDHAKRLPRDTMQPGDQVIGIASNGLHTNGFSLARRALLETAGRALDEQIDSLGTTIGQELLRPHKSYLHSVLPVLEEVQGVHAACHVTGGGLPGNLPRVLPAELRLVIDRRSWTPLEIFRLIQDAGSIGDGEMYRVFNMGIGMALVVDRDVTSGVLQRLAMAGEMAAVIGEVQRGPHEVQIV